MTGTFVSSLEAGRILERVQAFGHDRLVDVDDDGHWLWQDPNELGRGPALSFCEAVHGLTPDGMYWGCVCDAENRGCVRPSHYELVRIGELPGVHPTVRTTFALRIAEERKARRDLRSFARELGVAQSTIKQWEAGLYPGRDVEDRIATKLGWGQPPQRWIVTVVFQAVEVADSAGAAAAQALKPLEREGFPTKAVVHSVAKVA